MTPKMRRYTIHMDLNCVATAEIDVPDYLDLDTARWTIYNDSVYLYDREYNKLLMIPLKSTPEVDWKIPRSWFIGTFTDRPVIRSPEETGFKQEEEQYEI